jgi:COP9 signalosome complex subunit 4
MASSRIEEALEQLSKAAQSDRAGGYLQLLHTIPPTSAPDRLTQDLSTFISSVFNASLGIVATRPLLTAFVETLRQVPSNDTKVEVGQHTLEVLRLLSGSFEEQDALTRDIMATAYEAEDDNLAAAKVLQGIHVESAQRLLSPEQKVRHLIRITRNFLEVDDTVNAETYLNRAKQDLYKCDDVELSLLFQLSQARIFDARRKFLEAAQGYHTLSFSPVIAEEERLHTLSQSIKCAVLAPAGPARSRMLGRLYKDERCAQLDEFSMLEKMFLDRLLTPVEVKKFAEGLQPHQTAKTADGMTVLDKAVVEHNLLGASRLYNNISTQALAQLLGLGHDNESVEDKAERAEEYAARMIEQGRLVGRIDQIDAVIYFEGGEEATGKTTNSGSADNIVGREIRRWDGNVKGLTEEVEKVTGLLQGKFPEFVAANLMR